MYYRSRCSIRWKNWYAIIDMTQIERKRERMTLFECHFNIIDCTNNHLFVPRLISIYIALTVQYLTGRFIGDYYSGTDLVYRHEIPHLGGSFTTRVDILDTSHSTDNVINYSLIISFIFFF